MNSEALAAKLFFNFTLDVDFLVENAHFFISFDELDSPFEEK